MVIQSLFASRRVHQGAWNLFEGGRLVGHGVGNDRVIINCDGNGLSHRNLVQTVGSQVVEGGWQAGANLIRSIGQVGGDGQPIFQPPILNIVIELLAYIHLTGFKCRSSSSIIGIDHVRQVLRCRQFAPHGSILAPVVIIPNEDNFRIVSEELVIGTGVNDVVRRIRHQRTGIITAARFQFLRPGFLNDIVAAQVSSHAQRIDRFACIKFGIDLNRLGVNSCNAIDGILITTVSGSVVDMGGPGIGNVSRGYRGAIAPLCGCFDLEGDMGFRGVPCKRAIRQQRIHIPIQHVVQVRGFEHGYAGVVSLADCHGIVAVGRVRIPADNRTPLLPIEVQGLIAGQHRSACR